MSASSIDSLLEVNYDCCGRPSIYHKLIVYESEPVPNGTFGLCPETGKSFLEKFPAEVYEPFPAPSTTTQQVQFDRAAAWEIAEQRYLHYMINPKPSQIGGFYARREDVGTDVFLSCYYPGDFRWFIVDPTQKEELRYLATQIENFWRDLLRDTTSWWYNDAKLIHDGIEAETALTK